MKNYFLAGLLLLSISAANAESLNWSFEPRQVSEIHIAVTWPPEDTEHQPLNVRIQHQRDQWLNAGRPFDSTPLARLGKTLKALEPALGLRDCSDGDEDRQGRDIYHPLIEVNFKLQARGSLRFRSASACALMLPWNVTDGDTLAIASQIDSGQAMRELLVQLCADCEFKTRPLPEDEPLIDARPSDSRFAALYNALLSEWRRLGSQHDATWSLLHTQHLIQALQWMDEKRFRHELEVSAHMESQPVREMARAVLLKKR
jgi:hypothetical protein